MVGAAHKKNLGSQMPKQSDDSCLQDDSWLISPFSWKNSLSETSLGESYILKIYIHLDALEKHSLDVEGVYNL